MDHQWLQNKSRHGQAQQQTKEMQAALASASVEERGTMTAPLAMHQLLGIRERELLQAPPETGSNFHTQPNAMSK